VFKKKRIAVALIFLLTVITAYRGGKAFFLFVQNGFAPRSISIVCSNIYSEPLQDDIKKFVSSTLVSRSYSDVDIPLIYKMLKFKFKVVKKMLWTWKSFDEAVLVVEGVKPAFFVNNKFVLGNKKRLLDSSMFSDLDMGLLKQLKLGDDLCAEKVSSDVYKVINEVPESYWRTYEVSYLGRHDIIFEPRDKKLIRYILDESVICDQDKIRRASYLAQETRRRLTVCDLRFRDRICVRTEKI
jgi:hypothetical protein